MTDTLIEKLHHKFGGSTAKFWGPKGCPAWAREMEKLPPQIVGKPAILGTALHAGILERKVRAEIEYLLKGTLVNVKYDDIPEWPTDGPDMAEDFWQALYKHVLEEIVTNKAIYIEHKLMLSEELDCGGSADVVVLHKNDRNQVVLWVGDLKTGRIRVEPSDEQLLFYICAANHRAKSKGVTPEIFKSFVYQPTHEEPFTAHKFSKSEVDRATKGYLKAIEESKKAKLKYKVGDYCKYCRAQATCKAYNAHVSKEMDVSVQATTTMPPVESLPDETLVKIWKAGDSIENYISAVRKHIIARFSQGQPLEGLKIVSGVAKRKWADEEEAISVLRRAGIDPVKQEIIGIGETEKRLKASGKEKKEVDALMYTLTIKPPAAPKVAAVEDKREAIDIQTVDLLGELDDVGEAI